MQCYEASQIFPSFRTLLHLNLRLDLFDDPSCLYDLHSATDLQSLDIFTNFVFIHSSVCEWTDICTKTLRWCICEDWPLVHVVRGQTECLETGQARDTAWPGGIVTIELWLGQECRDITFTLLPGTCRGETEENKEPQSVESVYWPRFQPAQKRCR
jgi:hypothetical protein